FFWGSPLADLAWESVFLSFVPVFFIFAKGTSSSSSSSPIMFLFRVFFTVICFVSLCWGSFFFRAANGLLSSSLSDSLAPFCGSAVSFTPSGIVILDVRGHWVLWRVYRGGSQGGAAGLCRFFCFRRSR